MSSGQVFKLTQLLIRSPKWERADRLGSQLQHSQWAFLLNDPREALPPPRTFLDQILSCPDPKQSKSGLAWTSKANVSFLEGD